VIVLCIAELKSERRAVYPIIVLLLFDISLAVIEACREVVVDVIILFPRVVEAWLAKVAAIDADKSAI
jgi:hypothetical protein